MRRQVHCSAPRITAAASVVLAFVIAHFGVTAVADDQAPPGKPVSVRPESIRAAVDRALPLLITASAVEYPKHRDCFSCHNQAVPAVALVLARERGFAVEAETLQAIAEHTEADMSGGVDEYRKGKGPPGGIIHAGYALWTLEVTGWKPDETTAALAHYLEVASRKVGHLSGSSRRPPSESSDFTATALVQRGLRAFPPSDPASAVKGSDPAKSSDQPPRAADGRWGEEVLQWLIRTKPRETEDRVFRLWGLKFAGAPAGELARAVSELLDSQRPDGGWSQLDAPAGMSKGVENGKEKAVARETPARFLESDAYATGSVLVALAQAGGIATDKPAYRRGLEFLLRTQRDDGSWFVKSRSHPFQKYFESGFPHGPDQFISAAASAWAVAALSLALPVR